VLCVYFVPFIVIKYCYCFPKLFVVCLYSTAAWIPLLYLGGGACKRNTGVWNAAPTSPTSSRPVAGVTVGKALNWPGQWLRVLSLNWRLRRPELEARGVWRNFLCFEHDSLPLYAFFRVVGIHCKK
jgi:hypothetical protein